MSKRFGRNQKRRIAPEVAHGLVNALRKYKQPDRRAWW